MLQKRGSKMRAYIRERLKFIICLTVLIMATVGLIVTNEIRASMLPVASEALELAFVEISEEVYDYTGEEIKPEISRLVFEDKDGKRVFFNDDEFTITGYISNVNVGQADVEVSLNGYQGTFYLEDVFFIQPARGQGIQIVSASKEAIELTWEETIDADGYQLYKKKNGTRNYVLIHDVKKGESLSYTDVEVELNAVYTYYVSAYKVLGEEIILGKASSTITHYTPLENPVISRVANAAYNTLQVEWPIVNGAVGYQVYRSDKQDGQYTMLAEIADGMTTTYTDATCECGKTYFYYIKACQKTDKEILYGDQSAVASGKTTPNKTYLNGITTDNNTKVTLNWKKVSGAQGYEVYKNNQLVKVIENADTVKWEETGLAKDTEAGYKVRAYCVVNNEKLFGTFSGNYEKEFTIIYNYGDTSAEIAALTQYAGRPYKFGGTSPTNGWDCSAFVQYVYKKHFGISLPRTASQQVGGGASVGKNNRSEWKPGDLLFYKEAGRVSHVAIYLGNGQMIHALSEKHDTLIQGVDYYEKWDTKTSLYCVKRYLQ